MKDEVISLKVAFTNNRAEELGLDVWSDFVVPLFYEEIDLSTADKARRIIGGRGCGKTMLLRYLSHHSQFSKDRNDIDINEIGNIGLYWRADTNFLPLLNSQGVAEEEWILVFKHYLTLITSIEILKSLSSIASSKCEALSKKDIQSLSFEELKDYDSEFSGGYEDILKSFKSKLRLCETRIHNPPCLKDLHKLPDSFVTQGLLEVIYSQLPAIRGCTFALYIDEYENLLKYQQKTINTKIKHGEPPLIYHVAIKRNGMKTNETLGNENIQGLADYRNIDLDKHLSEDFDVFAAEILLHRISKTKYSFEEFNADLLSDIASIRTREMSEYKGKVIYLAKSILPGLTQSELAKSLLANNQYKKELEDKINIFIENSETYKLLNMTSDMFFVDGFEEASIIVPSLLARKNLKADKVLSEYGKLCRNQVNDFTGKREWISNNFIGSYLKFYRVFDKKCPFYSGFSAFVKMSHGNIRHFLELCNSSIKRMPEEGKLTEIPIDIQALATRVASEDILNEAQTYGRLGSSLQNFIFNLAHLFEFSHMRESQSEPEVNHFSIKGGFSALKNEDKEFLDEAEKWGVLYKEKITKDKDGNNVNAVDWILNPIYSPYFMISYRKNRKLEFEQEMFRILYNGSKKEIDSLNSHFKKKWSIDEYEAPTSYSLF